MAVETHTTAPPAPKPETVPAPGFSWDELLPVMAAPATSIAPKRFQITDIPAPIRQRIELSLGDTEKALKIARDAASQSQKDPGKAEKEVPPQWKLQPVASEDMAAEFLKLARKYAQYRPTAENGGEKVEYRVPGTPVGQITLRGAYVQYVVQASETDPAKSRHLAPEGVTPGHYVRYAAKPMENRSGSGK